MAKKSNHTSAPYCGNEGYVNFIHLTLEKKVSDRALLDKLEAAVQKVYHGHVQAKKTKRGPGHVTFHPWVRIIN